MLLSDANNRWHDVLTLGYQDFLETLTTLEFPLATQQWAAFRHTLSTHIDFEQTHIEPLASLAGDGEDNTLKLIQSDHLILMRLIPKLDQALDEIRHAKKPRRLLVNKLGDFIKMRNVLEHHDLRENEALYPLLDKQLEQAQRETLAQKMDDAREAL